MHARASAPNQRINTNTNINIGCSMEQPYFFAGQQPHRFGSIILRL